MDKNISTINNSNTSFSLKEIREMAEYVATSGLFEGIRTVEAAVTLMMLCQAENLHPIKATQRYHIIKGRPSMKADALLGEFQARGGKVKWLTWNDTLCEAIFFAPGVVDGVTIDWTIERAQRANLTHSTAWKHYPRNMLRARVISDGIRMCMSSIIAGIYTTEEASDMPELQPPAKKISFTKNYNLGYNQNTPPIDIDEWENVVEDATDTTKDAILAEESIEACESMDELEALGEQIKSFPEKIKKHLRSKYKEKLNQLKEKRSEI